MDNSNTWTPGVRSCPMCGKPEHGSVACEWAPGWPVVAQPQPPNDHEILLNEVREMKHQLATKLDDELKQLRAELNKERWMRKAAMRDAMNGADIPFSWDDYLEMLSDLYESTHSEQ